MKINNLLEIEKQVIGIILKNHSLIFNVNSKLDSNSFSPINRSIYDSINEMINNDKKISIPLLVDTLNKYTNQPKEGWKEYLLILEIEAGYEKDLNFYCGKLLESSNLRRLTSKLTQIISELKTGDNESRNYEDIIYRIENHLYEYELDDSSDFLSIKKVLEDYSSKLDKIKKEGYKYGIETMFSDLNRMIGGFKEGELIIIAARPSMGKTALALEITRDISKRKSVAFVSIEMPREQLVNRMINSEGSFNFNVFDKINVLDKTQKQSLKYASSTINKLNLWIDDSPSSSIEKISSKIRKLNLKEDIDLVIIDYIQLISTDTAKRENRQQQVSYISRKLKELARDINKPVIVLSQLSRAVEARESKKPVMSDIRESGAIEQDADIIMMLYREKYYEGDDTGGVNQDLEISIKKNRNGPTGKVVLTFDISRGILKNKYTNS